MTSHIDSMYQMISSFEPDKIVLYTDSKEFIESLCDRVDNTPIIIATNRPPLSSQLQRSNVRLRKVQHPPPTGLEVLDNAESLVLRLFSEALLDVSDRVVLVLSTNVQSVMCFEMSRIGVASLRDVLSGRVDLDVVESAFKLASVVVQEGKEGLPAGALLLLGDVNRVAGQTKEVIRNPLEGCSAGELNLKDRDNWTTLKEYSMMDGATMFDRHGNPIAAGRYVLFDGDEVYEIEEGLGGRHLAAAAISAYTKTIAMAVSSEGVIRVYKDGEKVFEYTAV